MLHTHEGNTMPARVSDPAQSRPWRSWYSLQVWRKRAKHQLKLELLCATCLANGRVTPATIADHHPAHGGDWNAFRLGPLRSQCARCHSRNQGGDEAHAFGSDIGADGFPIDPRHPFNRAR